MPSRTPYTDLLHTQGLLITRHPLPEMNEHPFDSAEDDYEEFQSREREVLMSNEDIEDVLYLNRDDIADSDESQEWQITQVERGISAR